MSSNKELNDTFASDLAKAELLSFPLTLLILVLAFGALVAALVPLLLGVTTVIAALGLIAFPSHLSPIDSNLQSVILLIGLAVSVAGSSGYRTWVLKTTRSRQRPPKTGSPSRLRPSSAGELLSSSRWKQ